MRSAAKKEKRKKRKKKGGQIFEVNKGKCNNQWRWWVLTPGNLCEEAEGMGSQDSAASRRAREIELWGSLEGVPTVFEGVAALLLLFMLLLPLLP